MIQQLLSLREARECNCSSACKSAGIELAKHCGDAPPEIAKSVTKLCGATTGSSMIAVTDTILSHDGVKALLAEYDAAKAIEDEKRQRVDDAKIADEAASKAEAEAVRLREVADRKKKRAGIVDEKSKEPAVKKSSRTGGRNTT